MAAAVIADGAALVFGHFAQVGNQLLDRQVLQLGAGDSRVDVVDIRLVMLRMMNLHRTRINMRFEGVVSIGERGKRIGHDGAPNLVARESTVFRAKITQMAQGRKWADFIQPPAAYEARRRL